MMFKLEIETDNAAFEESTVAEVARILRVLIARLESGEMDGGLRDANGNRVGHYVLMDETAE